MNNAWNASSWTFCAIAAHRNSRFMRALPDAAAWTSIRGAAISRRASVHPMRDFRGNSTSTPFIANMRKSFLYSLPHSPKGYTVPDGWK